MNVNVDEQVDLELLVTQEDDLRCEMPHQGTIPCTVVVTHIAKDCRGRFFVCAAAAMDIEKRRQYAHFVCKYCHAAVVDCWITIAV